MSFARIAIDERWWRRWELCFGAVVKVLAVHRTPHWISLAINIMIHFVSFVRSAKNFRWRYFKDGFGSEICIITPSCLHTPSKRLPLLSKWKERYDRLLMRGYRYIIHAGFAVTCSTLKYAVPGICTSTLLTALILWSTYQIKNVDVGCQSPTASDKLGCSCTDPSRQFSLPDRGWDITLPQLLGYPPLLNSYTWFRHSNLAAFWMNFMWQAYINYPKKFFYFTACEEGLVSLGQKPG